MSEKSRSFFSYLRSRWEALLVVIFAFFYYASYYRCGLNLGGEGGTAGVIALRLMEGQRPIVDTFLGYNVLWFYPITWLFELFGPNYLALKVFFFSICTITALLVTLLVRRATGSSFLAVVTGILVVLVPGMQFRNYLPFLGVLNMATLFQVFIFSHRTDWQRVMWRGIAGLALGITFLIRIDVGFLIAALVLGLFLVSSWFTEFGPLRGFLSGLKAVITIGLFALVVHLLPIWDAYHRGFQDQFLSQYGSWINELRHRASSLQKNFETSALPPPLAESVVPLPPPTTTTESSQQAKEPSLSVVSASPAVSFAVPEETKAILSRPPLSDLFHRKPKPRMFAWALYLPIPIIAWMLMGIGVIWLTSAWKRNFEENQRATGVLLALGCSLALFPQYFFFRPDTPHLSEFMVPFVVVMTLACTLAVYIAKNSKTKGKFLPWIYAIVLLFLCVLDVVAHVYNGLRRESSGSIAALRNRGMEFTAANGVRVLVREKDFQILRGIYTTIMANSSPQDWVVCYPYSPTVNFMTNRRSYEFNLYVDNATRTDKFDSITINKLLTFQPAVVMISNYAINKNECSRFRNWAAPTYEFIANNYRLAAAYGYYEIYVRKDYSKN